MFERKMKKRCNYSFLEGSFKMLSFFLSLYKVFFFFFKPKIKAKLVFAWVVICFVSNF